MVKVFKTNNMVLKIVTIVIIFCLFSFLFIIENILNNLESEKIIDYGSVENSSYFNYYFCTKDDCLGSFLHYLDLAQEEIKCALFELDNENLSLKLNEKIAEGILVSLIVDFDYVDEDGMKVLDDSVKIFSDKNRGTKYDNFMHNKFCIVDDRYILTGSMNPTENGMFKNNNNLIIFDSLFLARNFENEFDQMVKGMFGYNKKNVLEYNNVTLKIQNDSLVVSSYFCPQNNCEKEVIDILNGAKERVVFASFAFTNDAISQTLINLSYNGINVSGIIEKRNYNTKGSDINAMSEYFLVYNDTNKNTMHHKFFVVDDKYVITGSMNPTGSGVKYNDENIVVVENKDMAIAFYDEYLSLIT